MASMTSAEDAHSVQHCHRSLYWESIGPGACTHARSLGEPGNTATDKYKPVLRREKALTKPGTERTSCLS